MANPEHLEILKKGIRTWNTWRENNADVIPDLSNVNLKQVDLKHILGNPHREEAAFIGANLSGANLSGSELYHKEISSANLSGANLKSVNLVNAHLWRVDFSMADLTNANLRSTIFNNGILAGADLSGSYMAYTKFIGTDLSKAVGLHAVRHDAPSNIDIDTLYRSGGKIPEAFLQGCGIPDDLITFIPSHFGIQQAIQFYSCFISYSTKDEEFARRLYSRMRDEHLRVWFAPEDIKGGQKLYEQIERAIQIHDRLLLVLSENSMQSEWVMTEIRRARKTEVEENRRKLFPIRLVEFDAIRQWKCFDSDTGKDLAIELREYYIPDFSNWKDHDSFEKAFDRLLRDLRAGE